MSDKLQEMEAAYAAAGVTMAKYEFVDDEYATGARLRDAAYNVPPTLTEANLAQFNEAKRKEREIFAQYGAVPKE